MKRFKRFKRFKAILTAACFTIVFFTIHAAVPPTPITCPDASGVSRPFLTQSDSLPTAFVLGQYDGSPFEKLKSEYDVQLLAVCRQDVEMAYYLWVHMLKHMESYAAKTRFDLDGVKLWLYVFWNKDGTMKNVAYYPKPNSKNFKAEDMTAFMTDFCRNYKFPMTHERNFSHYSTANFPVMVEKEKTAASIQEIRKPIPTGNGNSNKKDR